MDTATIPQTETLPVRWHEPQAIPPSMLSPEKRTDAHVVELWLGRFESPHTRKLYTRAARRLLEHAGSLQAITLDKLADFAETVTGQASSRATMLASVKSLLTFAHEIGYTPFNTGKALPLPKIKNTLAERILDEADTIRLVETPRKGTRNNVLLRLIYTSGARVSEVTGLVWRDVQARDHGRGQICLFGKGGKTRVVVIENPKTWSMLLALRGDAGDGAPVFRSRQGGHLSAMQVERIVGKNAKLAGLTSNVSPHWLRHAHASHALDNGATIAEVQTTLGHASLATTSKYTHARPGSSSGRKLKV